MRISSASGSEDTASTASTTPSPASPLIALGESWIPAPTSVSAGARSITSDRAYGTAIMDIESLDLQLRGSGGVESSNYASASREKHTTWGAGLVWEPSPRTRVDAMLERRAYGTSHQLSAQYRTPRTAWSLTSSRSLDQSNGAQTGSLGTAYNLFAAQLSSAYPDPAQRDAAVVAFYQAVADSLPRTAAAPLAVKPEDVAAIVDEAGHDIPNGTGGILVVKRPWPSMLRTIWGDDERFVVLEEASGGGRRMAAVGDARTPRASVYASYTLLENLGFGFLHPLAPTVPPALTPPANSLKISEAPRWPSFSSAGNIISSCRLLGSVVVVSASCGRVHHRRCGRRCRRGLALPFKCILGFNLLPSHRCPCTV